MTEREIAELFTRPLDPDTEERALREELAAMMRRHAAARQPIVGRIVQLQAMKPMPQIVTALPTAQEEPSSYSPAVQLRRIFDALPRGPRCRDCADEDGRCPAQDRPCDPVEWVVELIHKATGQ